MSGSGVTNADGGLVIGGTDASSYYSMFLDQRTFNNAGAARFQRSASGGGYYSILYLSSGATSTTRRPPASTSLTTTSTSGAMAALPPAAPSPMRAPSPSPPARHQLHRQWRRPEPEHGLGCVSLRHPPAQRRRHVRRDRRGDGGRLVGDDHAADKSLWRHAHGGATWIVDANSSMSLDANITTDAATIILDGTGANFTSLAPCPRSPPAGAWKSSTAGRSRPPPTSTTPGPSTWPPARFNISGNYTQESTGAYDVAVGGLAAGSQFGQLNVTRQASLDGALSVSLINGYTPPQGDSYPILTFGTGAGTSPPSSASISAAGGASCPPSTPDSTALDLVVIAEQAGTPTTVQSSENPSNYGESVTFTATVTPTVRTSLSRQEPVTFFDGATQIGSETLVNRLGHLHDVHSRGGIAVDRRAVLAATPISAAVIRPPSRTWSTRTPARRSPRLRNPSVWGQSVHVHRDRRVLRAGGRDADRPGHVLRRHDAIDTETLNGDGFVHHLDSARRRSLDHGELRRGHGFLASTSHGVHPDRQPGRHDDGRRFVDQSQCLRPVGDVHGHGDRIAPGERDTGGDGHASTTAPPPSIARPSAAASASYNTSSLAVGGHSITLEYAPPPTSPAVPRRPLPRPSTRTAARRPLSSSVNPSTLGQSVTFTATVSAASPGSGTADRQVTFYDGTTAIDTETLSAGSATFTTSSLALGDHAISVEYGGDTDFTGSTSATITEVVKQGSTTTAVTSSVNPRTTASP